MQVSSRITIDTVAVNQLCDLAKEALVQTAEALHTEVFLLFQVHFMQGDCIFTPNIIFIVVFGLTNTVTVTAAISMQAANGSNRGLTAITKTSAPKHSRNFTKDFCEVFKIDLPIKHQRLAKNANLRRFLLYRQA